MKPLDWEEKWRLSLMALIPCKVATDFVFETFEWIAVDDFMSFNVDDWCFECESWRSSLTLIKHLATKKIHSTPNFTISEWIDLPSCNKLSWPNEKEYVEVSHLPSWRTKPNTLRNWPKCMYLEIRGLFSNAQHWLYTKWPCSGSPIPSFYEPRLRLLWPIAPQLHSMIWVCFQCLCLHCLYQILHINWLF